MEFCIALAATIIISPVLFIAWLAAAVATSSNGWFTQLRVGQDAKLFKIYKLRTISDGKISATGGFLRKSKLDELPQLINILKGDMAFVGPRPDLPGYYDRLVGTDRRVLQLRPGITSPAAIKYRNEEELLSQQVSPLEYNDQVIFPDKVRMNLAYLEKRSFWLDIKILIRTLTSLFT